VHNALRALFDLSVERRTPDRAAHLVEQYWSNEGFRDDGQASTYRDRARRWVADYVSDHGDCGEPVGLERWVSTPAGSIVAEGRVDRIDQRGDELVVVDYKTGRRTLTDEDARSSQALALYVLAARRTLRRPCRRVELHHLPSRAVVAWEHSEVSLKRHLSRMEESAADAALATDTLAAGGDAEVLFPPRPTRSCAYCDFRRHCPEGRDAADEAEPWALLAP
jgi:RecB family exonuclease